MLRATFRSLLSRKLRLMLSGLAVILGVMFVSGSFVLTSTLGKSFDSLFADAYSHVHVMVQGPPTTTGAQDNGEPAAQPLAASVLDQVKAVGTVAGATGLVQADGVKAVGPDGKVLKTSGAPQFGENWSPSALVSISQGRAPAAPDEIVAARGVVTDAQWTVGEQVNVSVLGVEHQYTLVGVFVYSGDRDSLGGEQTIAFTTPIAQQLLLGGKDLYSAISVTPKPGVSDTQLRDDVAKALGGGFDVETGKQLGDKTSKSFAKQLSFVNDIFLGFAGVALFVGIFLILNTFSIIVAQRTRELALLRAIGASRKQMIGSVMTEAIVIGVLASTLGMIAGLGVGALLAYVFTHVGGGSLKIAGVGLPASAVIASYTVGIAITLIAALLPALRASRVAPIAAMREAATPDRPLTRLTVIGAIILAAGGALLGTGLSGAGSHTLALILAGVLIGFIGVAVLTPAISRPLVAVLGALFSWSLPGLLGKRNSARNPRRTAITASALMVGIALITGVTVILQSAKTSISDLMATTVKAQLVISGSSTPGAQVGFDPQVLDRTAALPGVQRVVGLYDDKANVNGTPTDVAALSDTTGLTSMFSLKPAAGSISSIGPDQILIDEPTATKDGLHIGDTITVQYTRGDPHQYTLSGIYAKSQLISGWVASTAHVSDFTLPEPFAAYVALDPGTSESSVKTQIDTMLANSPEASVDDFGSYVRQQADSLDTVLTIIQVLLALAIVIAILGVINTLALSVLERTRELGLLRAIGLSRARTMGMVTVESVVISVFGAILGLAVGVGLGASVVRALKSQGLGDLTLPYGQMIVILILSAIVGVVAAVLPAIRAARTNVLAAISYE